MKLRSLLMFLGCLFGGLGATLYWYSTSCSSGNCEMESNFFSVILYGLFIGLFFADLLSQTFFKQTH